MTATVKPIALNNAYVVRQELREYTLGGNLWELAGEVPDLQVRFSEEPTGFTDEGFPSTLLGPYDMAATIDVGVFAVIISADDVGVLSDFVGEVIYQIVEGSYDTGYFNLTDVQPLLVIDPRNPSP